MDNGSGLQKWSQNFLIAPQWWATVEVINQWTLAKLKLRVQVKYIFTQGGFFHFREFLSPWYVQVKVLLTTAFYLLPLDACHSVTFTRLHLIRYFSVQAGDAVKHRVKRTKYTGLEHVFVKVYAVVVKWEIGHVLFQRFPLVLNPGSWTTGPWMGGGARFTYSHGETSWKTSDMWCWYCLMVSDENEIMPRQSHVLQREEIECNHVGNTAMLKMVKPQVSSDKRNFPLQ